MGTAYPPVAIMAWGELACFTRPEMKVERVSYPVITPSAARGLLESIFWKPEFVWRITEIRVLRPIRYISIMRNEVNTRQSHRAARAWEREGGGFVAARDRTQRHTLALRDVAYVIRAEVDVKPEVEHDAAKYRDQFRRRAAAGRCFQQPYFGCREFAAHFGPVSAAEQPLDLTDDLGLMLLDMSFPSEGDAPEPIFFQARLEHGVLRVPGLQEATRAAATAG